MNTRRELYQVFNIHGKLLAHITAPSVEDARDKFARVSGVTQVMNFELLSKSYHRDVCEIYNLGKHNEEK